MLFPLFVTILLGAQYASAKSLAPGIKHVRSNADCDTVHAPVTNCAYYIFIAQEINPECSEHYTVGINILRRI